MQKPDNCWPELNRILEAALELEGPAQLEYIKHACGSDDSLRREVEAMLSAVAQAQARDFLAEDAFAVGAGLIAKQLDTNIPSHLGQYKILREIGRGGMGAVFLAEREDPHQLVAIKIIKRGMDTDEIIGRFRRERQVLANLRHPHIANLLDAATTADGLPYFVMEYVEGLPITKFCDQQKLNINQRLELFQKVCSAVSYIHRNLIVHRDIKPSNIMVSAEGEPKLLDFGIAKLMASEAGMTVEQTVAEARLLTPDYASPEQILGEKITTASDVYSLGVVLYEMLCGRRPFRLRDRSTTEILEISSHREALSPSAAVLNTKHASESNGDLTRPEVLADLRGERLPVLRRRLNGDLDNITLKALKKEGARRYQTVEQFSEDVTRYLTGRPVLARPDTFAYRAAKFVKRNRVPSAMAALLTIALTGGIVATVWQSVRASRQRALAEQRAAETRQLANTLLTEFDEELGNLPGGYPTRIKLANASSEYLEKLVQQTNDPAVMKEVAEAHLRLAGAYSAGFDQQLAQKHLQQSIGITRKLVSGAPGDLALKELLAEGLSKSLSVEDEVQRIGEALRLRQEIATAQPENARALRNLADSYFALGVMYKWTLGRMDEALSAYRKWAETNERVIRLLDKPSLTADEYDVLLGAYYHLGLTKTNDLNDLQGAIELSRKAIPIAEAAAAKFSDRRTYMNLENAHGYLAHALFNHAEYQEALDEYELALKLGDEAAARFNVYFHPNKVRYLLRMTDVLMKLGDKERTEARLREALAVRREASVIDRANPKNLQAHASLCREVGFKFKQTGNNREALVAYQEAGDFWRKALAQDPTQTGVRWELARLDAYLGDLHALSSHDSVDFRQTNRARLREACSFYKQADDSLKQERAQITMAWWKGYADVVSQKAAACAEKLR